MNNAVFGNLIFNTGWKTETDVTLFDKTYKVVVKVKAYRETDGVTAGQESAYSDFCENRVARLWLMIFGNKKVARYRCN